MIKPCAKCGRDWNQESDLIDTIYPSKRNPYTGEFIKWNIVCQTHNTGCGRVVYGKTKQEAIERWNNHKTDETVK